jgi:hypothetical protein
LNNFNNCNKFWSVLEFRKFLKLIKKTYYKTNSRAKIRSSFKLILFYFLKTFSIIKYLMILFIWNAKTISKAINKSIEFNYWISCLINSDELLPSFKFKFCFTFTFNTLLFEYSIPSVLALSLRDFFFRPITQSKNIFTSLAPFTAMINFKSESTTEFFFTSLKRMRAFECLKNIWFVSLTTRLFEI